MNSLSVIPPGNGVAVGPVVGVAVAVGVAVGGVGWLG